MEEIREFESDDDSLGESYRIKLDMFEGPLDLLLHLIKRAKIRICDIFVSDITKQFVEIINNSEILDLDKASNFLSMAATLLEIKAKSLLPKPEIPSQEDDEEKNELIRKLKEREYELYKNESEKLKDLETVNMHFRNPDPTVGDERTVLKDMTMDGLLEALKKIYSRIEKRSIDTTPKEIVRDPFTVEEKITSIRNTLDAVGKTRFSDLFGERTTVNEVTTTFQAILELMKIQYLTAQQNEIFGEIGLVKLEEKEE